ncbi:MAG: hypothetical protein QOC65_1022 [Sphingomonadales bacterium]|nr:hypothetical protein [Sphingomonadales bacterium]
MRDDGLLSEEGFETQKRRILDAESGAPPEATDGAGGVAEPVEDWRGWGKIALIIGAFLLLALVIGVFFLSSSTEGNASHPAVRATATSDPARPLQPAAAYTFRSNVAGAPFGALDQLPAVTPYGGDRDGYCGARVRSRTPGGRIAERRGWRVVREVSFHGLHAVLVVRGYDPGTSGHCFSKDPNLAFFRGDRLLGMLYSAAGGGIGMNDIRQVGEHLRVWDDLSPVGQISLDGTSLTFDRVAGNDAVCEGRYRVPAVFGQPYSRARRILRGAGWIALPSTEETFEGDRTEDYRGRFPEAESCSGTGYGYCNFTLSTRNAPASLVVTTAGEEADPVVTNYEVSCDGRR